MKKVLKSLFDFRVLKRTIINVIQILIDFVVDFLFVSRLLFELNHYRDNKELTFNHLRVFLQFMGKSFDNSPFEFYNINKEDHLHIFYVSLKKHNNLSFQIFCFFHCFFFNYLFYNLFWVILPNNEIGIIIRCKVLNKIWERVNEFIIKRVNNA